MRKTILFRADGNCEIGLGHLYRLFSLVEIYINTYECIFLTRSSTTISVIPEEYFLDVIPDDISLDKEASWIKKKYGAKEYIIIADGYQFDTYYQERIKNEGYYLIYIDDLFLEYIYADLIVNHSPSAIKEKYKAKSYTKFALGTDFAILRPCFLSLSKKQRNIVTIDTAFICYGGADQYDFTLQTVNSLLKSKEIKKINVVVGGAYQHDSIYKIAQEYSHVDIYKNLCEEQLSSLMLASNISFVSSSTILYEVMTVKMVIFTGYFVENQVEFYRGIQKEGAFCGLEDLCKFDFNQLPLIIRKLTKENIQEQIENQKRIIDGNQKKRFLKLLEEAISY